MAVSDSVREILSRRHSTIALVGASNAPHKYGSIILQDLRRWGYTVLPVNPRTAVVAGTPALRSVNEADGPVHIISVVVPPGDALNVAQTASPELCDVIWFQPGSFDDEVLAVARSRFGTVIAGDCIMVVARQV